VSNTGKYRYDREMGKVVKISDDIPKVRFFVYGFEEKSYHNLGDVPIYCDTKRKLRYEMDKRGLRQR